MTRIRGALARATAAVSVFLLSIAAAAAAFAAPAQGLSASVTVRADGVYYGATGLGTPNFPLLVNQVLQLRQGTAAGQADKLYAASRTLAASGSESLDLAGGLVDPLGASLTFVKVKSIVVLASSANTNSVIVGGAVSNGFLGPFVTAADKVSLPPGGALVLTHPGAGWTVTAGTGDLLQVANSAAGSTVTYRVILIGTSA